jgi:hypothetical protein
MKDNSEDKYIWEKGDFEIISKGPLIKPKKTEKD